MCLSVDQLRTTEMTKLGMTCYTKRDSKVVSCDGDVFAQKLRADDYVKIGNFPPMKIASIVSSGVSYERVVQTASIGDNIPNCRRYCNQYCFWHESI